jgi:hypothetical protein
VPKAEPHIETGWSVRQVTSVLGQPNHTDNVNGQTVCTFGHKRVTFEKGKVVAIEN